MTQAKNRLANSSLAWRAEREVREARVKFGGSFKKLWRHVISCIPAIIKCYQGKHKYCTKHSLVCDGKHMRYEYLPKLDQGNFRFTQDDVRLLSVTLQKRMGSEALRRTRFGFTTQRQKQLTTFLVLPILSKQRNVLGLGLQEII